jgi:exonuclease SbcC
MGRRLDAEKRARPVIAAHETFSRVHRELQRLEAELKRDSAALIGARATAEQVAAHLQGLNARTEEIDQAKAERLELAEHWKKAKALDEEMRKSADLDRALNMSERELEAAERSVLEGKARLLSLNEKALQLSTESGRVDALRAERDLLQREAKVIDESRVLLSNIEKLEVTRAELDLKSENARAKVESEKRLFTEARLSYHTAQAAWLARELAPDSPCPVCGSLEHPHPALLPESTPSQDELDRLEARVALAEKACSECLVAAARVVTEIENKRAELTRNSPLAAHELAPRSTELAKLIAAKDQAISLATEARLAAHRAKDEASICEAAIKTAEETCRELQTRRERARESTAISRSLIAQLETDLPNELRDPAKIESLGRALKTKIESYQRELQETHLKHEEASRALASLEAKVQTLTRELDERGKEASTAEAELTRLMAAAGFTELEAALKTRLSAKEVAELERARLDFENERAVIHDRLRELEARRKTLPQTLMPLIDAEKNFNAVERERHQLLDARGALREKLATIQEARRRLTEMNESTAQAEKQFATLGRLADVAQGQPPHNLTRVNFQRFVLAAQLDEVLEQASHRLQMMSRERFVLKRAKSLDDKRKNAGLDLEVEDSFTGSSRPTPYLSGGEGFLASLALALGLADVVQSHLGGVRLDAVFVDEGFGTLDAETLDLAMKVLSELTQSHAPSGAASGGRLVGIISHVPELREQVAHRLFVRKSPIGSEVLWEGV